MANSSLSSVKNSSNTTLNLLDFQIVYLTITILLTLLGNVLVLATIYYDSRLRTVTNYFVACLAVSDILVACFSVTIRLKTFIVLRRKEPLNQGALNIHVCSFYIWIDSFCEAASIYTLAVISIDRYLKISRPFQYRERMTKTVAVIIIVAIWVLSALLASLSLVPFDDDAQGVKLYPDTCNNDNKIYYTMASVVAFFFPLLVLIIMYTLIFRIALYHFKKENAMTMVDPVTGKQLSYSAYKDLKAIRTIFIVVSTFVICWGPFFVLFQIQQHQPTVLPKLGDKVNIVLRVVFFTLLPYSNSFFNPIIYACFDRIYRRSFRKIFLKIIGRSEYLANAKEYNGRNRQRNTSVFELTMVQSRDTSFAKRDVATNLGEDCFCYDESEKFCQNGCASSPSGRLTNFGPDESDEMLVYEDK